MYKRFLHVPQKKIIVRILSYVYLQHISLTYFRVDKTTWKDSLCFSEFCSSSYMSSNQKKLRRWIVLQLWISVILSEMLGNPVRNLAKLVGCMKVYKSEIFSKHTSNHFTYIFALHLNSRAPFPVWQSGVLLLGKIPCWLFLQHCPVGT